MIIESKREEKENKRRAHAPNNKYFSRYYFNKLAK